MTIFQALVLGIIQGITEFLPVSSSGHLIFLPALLRWPDQGLAFDVVVHLGTLAAVVWYFRRKLHSLILSILRPSKALQGERRLVFFLVLSIIPAGLAGLFLGDWIQGYARSATWVAYGLIGWGVVLGGADWYSRTRLVPAKALGTIRSKDVLVIALAQALALLPGTSRSGITMTAGLFQGFSRQAVAEFSFLMSIPVIGLAGAVKLLEVWKNGWVGVEPITLAVGFVAAAVSGLLAIWGMFKTIQRFSFLPFVIYRVVIGVLILWII